MDIWVKTRDGTMVNMSNIHEISIWTYETLSKELWHHVCFYTTQGKAVRTFYKSDDRCKEIIGLIQDYINSIGTNNFNNLPMVYEIPKE